MNLSPLIRRIEALEKQKRRVMLVDGDGKIIELTKGWFAVLRGGRTDHFGRAAVDEMTDENNSDPVIGDGVITLPGENDMSIELGATLSELLLSETAGNIQSNNMAGRNTSTLATSTLQAGMSKQFNELDPTESRSVSGVLATPLAPPTTQ